MAFIYQDAKGNITARIVSSISESKDHYQGHCQTANALRTFRKDRILEVIDDMNIINERLEYFISISPPPKASQKDENPFDICFTGFKKEVKEELKKLAIDAGLLIRSSVTKELDFLCYGYNAGPKKLEKARYQGVLILSENQFRVALKTGEIPEEP